MKHLKEKVEAGADFIVTQLFFDNEDYFNFVRNVRERGIQVPFIAGIMPIKDFDQIKRFTSMCGAKIPGPLFKRLETARGDKDRIIEIGIDYASQTVR